MRIRMTIPYENGVWSAVGYGLAFAFLVPLTVALAFKAKQYIGALICVVLAAVLLYGAWKRFSYGMRISEKRVVLRSHRETKVVTYDAVREIVVTFTRDNVAACVKMADDEFRVVWDDIWVDSRKIGGLGWRYNDPTIRVAVRMTDRFVVKSIERLSQCEKVRIENLYFQEL